MNNNNNFSAIDSLILANIKRAPPRAQNFFFDLYDSLLNYFKFAGSNMPPCSASCLYERTWDFLPDYCPYDKFLQGIRKYIAPLFETYVQNGIQVYKFKVA